jgi:hypothetical protein
MFERETLLLENRREIPQRWPRCPREDANAGRGGLVGDELAKAGLRLELLGLGLSASFHGARFLHHEDAGVCDRGEERGVAEVKEDAGAGGVEETGAKTFAVGGTEVGGGRRG